MARGLRMRKGESEVAALGRFRRQEFQEEPPEIYKTPPGLLLQAPRISACCERSPAAVQENIARETLLTAKRTLRIPALGLPRAVLYYRNRGIRKSSG